jgi:molybdopterin-guanine dinucleotide biosynthesis protein B
LSYEQEKSGYSSRNWTKCRFIPHLEWQWGTYHRMRIFAFVAACSNSGKTTLIEKIVPILKKQGVRVSVIKHASAGFDLDKPGKDSWRFQRAGADTVVLIGPRQMAVMKEIDREPAPNELEQWTADADIIIHEGFKQQALNRIEVFRYGVSGTRPLALDDPSFLALVSDRHYDVGIPFFDLNNAEGVALFLLAKMDEM